MASYPSSLEDGHDHVEEVPLQEKAAARQKDAAAEEAEEDKKDEGEDVEKGRNFAEEAREEEPAAGECRRLPHQSRTEAPVVAPVEARLCSCYFRRMNCT